MSTRAHLVVSLVIVVAWFGLAVLSFARGAPWYVPVMYAGCGVVMAVLARRILANSRARSRAAGAGNSTATISPAGRARRSGNPAVRASADETDPRG